jgi:hypothetical protein
MRNNTYILAAAVTALATAGTCSAFAQGAAPATPAAPAPAAAPSATAGALDPDAKYLIGSKAYSAGISGLDQRGCETSDKVIGTQPIPIDGYLYGGCLAKGADKNVDAMRVLVKASQATGQYRNVAYGFSTVATYLVIGDTTPMMRIEGKGSWQGESNVKVRMDWDYRVPGVRLYVTHANGSQDITVMADPRVSPTGRFGHLDQPELFGSGPLTGVQLATWKEKPAGVYSGPSDANAQELLALEYLMPTNLILAGRDAADKIKTARLGKNDVLTIPVPRLGGANLAVTLAADGSPTHAEVTVNGKKYTGDYGNYLSDRGDYEVQFPHQVTIQVDGKPIADWQLDFHHVNPYLVFPVPTQVAAATK